MIATKGIKRIFKNIGETASILTIAGSVLLSPMLLPQVSRAETTSKIVKVSERPESLFNLIPLKERNPKSILSSELKNKENKSIINENINENPLIGYSPNNFYNPKIENQQPKLVNNLYFNFNKNKSKSSITEEFSKVPSNLEDILSIGLGALTSLVSHETGHQIVADYVGAKGSKTKFFTTYQGDFYLGLNKVGGINEKSRLPYSMGGEFISDLMFEEALRDYRKKPNMFNKAVLLISGTDMLRYSAFSKFSGKEKYKGFSDPDNLSKQTGLSKDAIISIALAKTILNYYRISSGEDKVVPYFSIPDKNSVVMNFSSAF